MKIISVRSPDLSDVSEKKQGNCVQYAKVADIAVRLIVSSIVGYTVAYVSTIPDWDRNIIIMTNVGILGAYGTLSTWGLFMFSEEVKHFLCREKTDTTCCETAKKICFFLLSTAVGYLAQIPTSEISIIYNGKIKGTITQLGGMWVQVYSAFKLIEIINDTAQNLPITAKKYQRLKLLNKAEKAMDDAVGSLKDFDIEHVPSWAKVSDDPKASVRCHALMRDVQLISMSKQKITDKCSWLSIVKYTVQFFAAMTANFYIVNKYVLAEQNWKSELSSPITVQALSLLSAGCLSYYLYLGTYRGSRYLMNLLTDCCKKERQQNFRDIYFPKISKSCYLLGIVAAGLPMKQLVEVTDRFYSQSTFFGQVYAACNVIAKTLFIYNAIQELVNAIIEEVVRRINYPKEVKLALMFENDFKLCRKKLRTNTLEPKF